VELKQWLNRGYEISKKLAVKKGHMETIGSVISNYEPREIEAAPGGNSSEINFIRWSEMKKEVDELQFRLITIDREVDQVLKNLENPNEYVVLYSRYIRRLTWKEIIEALQYSEQHTFKLHKEGVENLDRITGFKDWED